MAIVYMRVQCSDRNAEVFLDDVEGTELTIESLVSGALLEVFDSVQVEDVTFRHSPNGTRRDEEQGHTQDETL